MRQAQRSEPRPSIAEEITGFMSDPGGAVPNLNSALPSNFRAEFSPHNGADVAFNAERRERWQAIALRKESEQEKQCRLLENEHLKQCRLLELPVGSSEQLINRESGLQRQIDDLRQNLPQLLDTAIESNTREVAKIEVGGSGFRYTKHSPDWGLIASGIALLPIYVPVRLIDWLKHRNEEFPMWEVRKMWEPRLDSAISPALDKLRALTEREGLHLKYNRSDTGHLGSVTILLPEQNQKT